jgi:putative nucleotidyltransferase with HDIG domain
MCRQESYRAGSRKPKVSSASLYSDILRRDFTINTLLLNINDGQILDLTGRAKSDIKAKLVKTTQDPVFIFKEDPLRMMRAVRFAVQLKFTVEKNTYQAICQQAEHINSISWERKRDELSKIMLCDEPARGLQMLHSTDLLKFLIPELLPTINCTQNKFHYQDVWQHTLQVLQNTKAGAEVRWAALLHDVGKPQTKSSAGEKIHFYDHQKKSAEIAAKVLHRLKFSKNFIAKVVFLVKNHLRTQNYGDLAEVVSKKKIRRLVYECGEDLENLLQLIHADNLAKKFPKTQQIPKLKQRIGNVRFSAGRKPPVSGTDIMHKFGLKTGKQVGALLKKAEQIWLEHPAWDKDKIISFLKKNGAAEAAPKD